MRSTFYTTDESIAGIVKELTAILKGWGLHASNSDVIRYALYYTAEGHGLRKRIPGRVFRAIDGRRLINAKHPDGQDRSCPDDDGAA